MIYRVQLKYWLGILGDIRLKAQDERATPAVISHSTNCSRGDNPRNAIHVSRGDDNLTAGGLAERLEIFLGHSPNRDILVLASIRPRQYSTWSSANSNGGTRSGCWHPSAIISLAKLNSITDATSPIRNVSDTALWVAYFRALETRRPDALFRDPYAERLAGERGFQIADRMSNGSIKEWAYVTRTYSFDSILSRLLQDGADLVLNLAAGLDTRPYRMQLPPTLQWVEVDLPEIIAYKEEILANDTPRCRLERVALDLSDERGRRGLFAALNERAGKIAVLSEGALIYFAPVQVASLARDLALGKHFQSWIVDFVSTAQMILLQRSVDRVFSEGNAEFKFGPLEGAEFFKPFGWESREIQGILKTAAEINRAPKEFLALLPDPDPIPPHYPWAGVCLLQKQA